MNKIEHQMLDILCRGRDHYGFSSIRAEFEAEGARRDELLRLLELGYKANLSLVIKIGGCEALRDLYEAKQMGASTIIAPMIETPYALQKYISAIQKCYGPEEQQDTQFYFNIETISAYQTQENLISLAQKAGLTGIVFGRVDFVGSLGLQRHVLNCSDITEMILKTARLCRLHNQHFILGGGIDPDVIPVIKQVKAVHLTRYETRKIALSSLHLPTNCQIKGLHLAAEFELLWLKNKQNYYHALYQEDISRIALLEQRMGQLRAA